MDGCLVVDILAEYSNATLVGMGVKESPFES